MSENKKEGFIPIYRSLFRHWLWDNTEPFDKRSAWIDLLRTARFEDESIKKMIDGKLIEINKTEIVNSIRYLQKRWNWKSTTKVENFLENLEKDDMIKTSKRQGITVITICNYNSYNDFIKTENTDHYAEVVRWAYKENIEESQRKDEIKQLNNITIEKSKEEIKPPTGVATEETEENFILEKKLGLDFIAVMQFISKTVFLKKLPKVLTAKEYSKLRDDFTQEQILEIFELMENSKSIRNKTSVYLTALNFLKSNFGNAEMQTQYEKFEQRYRDFIKKISNGEIVSPKIDKYDKSNLRGIIQFLLDNSVDKNYDGAYKSWEFILDRWTLLDAFMQQRTKLNEINSDIMKITNCIKNAVNKKSVSTDINTASVNGGRKDY